MKDRYAEADKKFGNKYNIVVNKLETNINQKGNLRVILVFNLLIYCGMFTNLCEKQNNVFINFNVGCQCR